MATVQTCIRALKSAIASRSRSRAWVGELQAAVSDLRELNRVTEADFLAIGGKLSTFLTGSQRLHSDIGGLTALVSGEQSRHACEALLSVRRFAEDMQRQSQVSTEHFLALQSAAARIHRRFATLSKIALSFHMTAVLARIETSNLAKSRNDLGNFADEVGACGDGIQSRADQVVEAARSFDSRIGAILLEVARLNTIQHKELPALLAAVDSDLAIFEARQREAAAASTKLSGDLESVTRDLAAISMSLQFHDITRQQVEHVVEAFEHFLSESPNGALSTSCASLMELQREQLKGVAAAFGSSTEKISRDLENIGIQVAAMAAASKSLLGLDHPAGNSFLADMQRRFGEVHRTVAESRMLQDAVRAIVADLEGLGQRLRISVHEVQAIELQLSRISINAAISASHIGAPGEPLNVVAGAMQTLQLDCATRSQEAEADLDVIGTSIISLAGESAPGDCGSNILTQLYQRIQELQSATVASADATAAITSLAETLSAKIEEAGHHVNIRHRFAETISRCCASLDSIAAQQHPWASRTPAIDSLHGRRYTMQIERDVHSSVAAGKGGSAPVEEPSPVQAETTGDDVEFF